MHILLLSRYGRLGASSRVRMYQYLPFLQQHGLSVTVSPLLADDYIQDLYTVNRRRPGSILAAYAKRLRDLRKASQFDLVWIEKEVFPWLPAWAERWLNRRRIPYIVDYDDAIFHNYDRNRRRVVRSALGRKIDEVMQRAAVVVVGNTYLADHAARAGANNVEIVPTVIDLDVYRPGTHPQSGTFTMGWIGTPITAPYLHAIETVMAEICRPGAARLVLIGSGNIGLKGTPLEVRPWTEESESTDVRSFDCGIMPLPDADWERGKCGYKLIQYMACAVPVVASPVGVNCQIVDHGVNGFLAVNNSDWTDALEALRDDPALRQEMGNAARRKVEQQYCLQVTAPRMVSLMHNAANKSGPIAEKDGRKCAV